MAMVYGASATEAGLDGNIVRATKLEEIAAKKLASCSTTKPV
jgi:hypothetical protein